MPRSLRDALPGPYEIAHRRRAGATRDAIAAGTIAAVAIPSSLGYAEVAGLPVVVGLYATMLPLVGYALWGSSRHVIVGPEGGSRP